MEFLDQYWQCHCNPLGGCECWGGGEDSGSDDVGGSGGYLCELWWGTGDGYPGGPFG